MWMYVETEGTTFERPHNFPEPKALCMCLGKAIAEKNKIEHFIGTAWEFVTESSSGLSSNHTERE